MISTDRTRAQHQRRPADELDIVRVATAFDYAQAALLLGEQRAWAEQMLGRELAEVQPSSKREFAHIASYYRPPHGKLLLARLDGDPVGVLGIRRLDGRRGEGKRLYVRPSARGHGVARLLVHELLSATRELGLESLYIETSPTRLPQTYEMCLRLGFVETRKLGFDAVDDVVGMQLDLDPAPAPAPYVRPASKFRRVGALRIA